MPLKPAAFSVSARVAMQLGRESISSSNTAIVELVKNAYDADADRVRIRFSGLGTTQPRMIVEDNGHGMTEGELREHWLCIGTTNKREIGKSPGKKRVQTGEKGLGRLGLDRLCERTILQSMRNYESEPSASAEMFPEVDRRAIELDIHWDRYRAAGKRLEAIEHEVTALEHLSFDPFTMESKPFLHGTRLILEGLKDDWTHDRLSELRGELSLLLSPFGRPEDFTVEIDSGRSWADVDGPVHAPISLLGLANWTVKAAIVPVKGRDANGLEIVTDEEVKIEVTSPSHDRAYIPAPMLWSEFVKHKGALASTQPHRSHCGPLRFEFYVFIRDAEDLQKRGSGISQIADFLASNRGIRIYRDGFRVKPFGDPLGQYDWLTLSLRRATNPAAISRPNWKVAYHQVVGAVFISRTANPSLVDQTNREGLVEGPAFDDLRLFADKVVQYFEGRAHEDEIAQNPRPKERPTSDKFSKEKVTEAIAEIVQTVQHIAKTTKSDRAPEPTNLIEVAVPKALEAIEDLQRAQERERKHLENEVSELRDEMVLLTSLASLGIMTASFGHERVNDATEVLNDAARLKKHIEDPQSTLFSKQDRAAMLDHLIAGAERIDAFAKFALDHVRPRKRQRQPVNLKAVVETTLKVFNELLCERFGAKVIPTFLGDGPFEVPGWEAGWESVLVNFITNASWALSKRPVSQRKISIDVRSEGTAVILGFEDSGVGLEAGTEEDIFRPGISTKRDDHGRLIGTGMGLTIVRSFVTSNSGTVTASNRSTLGGARFEVRVPKVSKPEKQPL